MQALWSLTILFYIQNNKRKLNFSHGSHLFLKKKSFRSVFVFLHHSERYSILFKSNSHLQSLTQVKMKYNMTEHKFKTNETIEEVILGLI